MSVNRRTTLLALAALAAPVPALAQQPPAVGAFAFDPQTRAYLEAEAKRPPTAGLAIDQIRAGYVESVRRTSVAPDPRIDMRELTIPGAAGPMRARVYTPPRASGKISGALLYIHGGGFAAGDVDSHDGLMRLIAGALGHRVISFDYRRAPEAQFPAARDDAVAAYRYLATNAAELQIDPARIAIGGESAGGAHAMATALALRSFDGPKPVAVLAFVPALDGTSSGETYRTSANGAGRTADEFRFLWSLYAPKDMARTDPGLSPFFADPAGLPPTIIYTAEFDPVRAEGEAFAAKARAARVRVTLRRQRGLIHQFPEITGASRRSRVAVLSAVRDLRAAMR